MTGDERSVLTDFASAARARCRIALCSRLTTSDPAWRGQSQEMSQNSVDTRLRIQIQRAFHCWNLGKLTTPGKTTSLRLKACRRKHHSAHTPSNEKEIRFPIRILQTSSPARRSALLCGDHNRPAGAAANALCAIGQFTSDCAGPISRRDAGGEVRYLAAAARHETAAWKECTLRENEDREIRRPLAPLGPVVPDPVVQRVLGKIGIPGPIIIFDGNSNLCGCVSARPQRSGRSQSCGDDVQPAFPNLRQDRDIRFSVRQRTTHYGADLVEPARPRTPAIQSCFTISWPIAGFLAQFTSAGPHLLRVCCAFADERSNWILFRWAIATGRPEIISPIIRKLECGRTLTTSARASSQVACGTFVGRWRVCAGSRPGFGR